MTNRIDYTDNYIEPKTKADEVMVIAASLKWKNIPLTLENATEALRRGLVNAPDMWKLTEDDLAALWAALVEEAL